MTGQISTHEEQLRRAQELIDQNNKRLAEAEALKLQALKARAAQIAADKAREQAEIQAKHEAAAEAIRQRRQMEKEEADRQKAEEAARNAQIQAEISRQEEVVREQNRKQAALDALKAQAEHLARQAELEQKEAERLLALVEAGIVKTITPNAEEDAEHKVHPLGRFLQSPEPVIPEPVAGEISSVELSLQQQRLDQMANQAEFGNVPVYASTAAPEPEAPKAEPVRKLQRYPDQAVSGELESLLRKELKISPNVSKCDEASGIYNYAPLMRAAKQVIEMAKVRPMAHDALFAMLYMILDTPEPSPEETSNTTSEPAQSENGVSDASHE